MKRVLCAIALTGYACAASAQLAESGGAAKTYARQDGAVVALSSHLTGARTFDDVLIGASLKTTSTDSQITASATPGIPEPRTYALLLAGFGAIVFVAVRRR